MSSAGEKDQRGEIIGLDDIYSTCNCYRVMVILCAGLRLIKSPGRISISYLFMGAAKGKILLPFKNITKNDFLFDISIQTLVLT